ncbi:MAG: cytochrome c-type biogenesis protein CcmH [Thermoleophilia bacterium]|nr:cytochrome c-type biogenesis protein CcmH [Thermoleophilia bacterium]
MRRAAVAALVAALAAVPAAWAGESRPTLADLEDELMCPVCGTTLDQSDAPVAQNMRMYIRARIAAGDSKSEIKDRLVEQFGEEVLAAPPREGFNLLAWVLPLAGLGLAVPALAYAAWRWSRGREPPPGRDELDPELERRLDRELARYEG